jgi:hypothetical protein
LVFCFVSATLFARAPKAAFHPRDPAYRSALATANRFLRAWQVEDHETGIIMLTDSARRHTSPQLLQTFFSPGSQAAYEIAHGKRLSSGAYVFPVALFGLGSSHSRYCKIIVTRAGKDEWAVDRLP